jgi:AcrR family transcriptional regulator
MGRRVAVRSGFDKPGRNDNIGVMDAQEDLRSRKSAPARIAQILDVADRLVIEAGALPISMKKVGDLMGASRALVYAYFPDPDHLAEAVLDRHMRWLIEAGIEGAAETGEFGARAQACAVLYLEHVARHGPIIHIGVRDLSRGASGRGAASRPHIRLLARLARAARRDLKLGAHEALVLLELLVTIPEEAGRLTFEGALDLEGAHALSARLLTSSIDAVRPRGSRPG